MSKNGPSGFLTLCAMYKRFIIVGYDLGTCMYMQVLHTVLARLVAKKMACCRKEVLKRVLKRPQSNRFVGYP